MNCCFFLCDHKQPTLLGKVKKRALKKISVNNKMRTLIRGALASFDLKNPDRSKRLAAVQQILDRADIGKAEIIRPLLQQEPEEEIREAMSIVIALSDLSSGDPQLRDKSVDQLSGNIHPSVRNALSQLQQKRHAHCGFRGLRHNLGRFERFRVQPPWKEPLLILQRQ